MREGGSLASLSLKSEEWLNISTIVSVEIHRESDAEPNPP